MQPLLHKKDRYTYSIIVPNYGALRSFLEGLGFRHTAPKSGDMFTHRWRSRDGRTVITAFPSNRLIVMGDPVVALDELVECAEVVE